MIKKIKLGYGTYKVKQKKNVKLQGSEMRGRIDFKKDKIEINKSYSKKQKKVTLLHEIFHAIEEHFGLELTEQEIEGLCNGFADIIHQNPKLRKELKFG